MESIEDFCVVTVTHARDLDRFERLSQSIDDVMPNIVHHVLVDRVDMDLFARFATDRRKIICTDSVLPQFRPIFVRGKRYWIGLLCPPIRPWIFQQLVKLAYTATLSARCAVLTDSDAIFLRAIDPGSLLQDGRVKLYHAVGAAQLPEHVKWHDAAARALKLPQTGYSGSDYISTAVPWSPVVVRALLAYLGKHHWRSWPALLASNFRFAEYILYGRFVREIPGEHSDQVFLSENEICHCSWHFDLSDPRQVDQFVKGLRPTHSALLIQSNLKLETDLIDRIAERVKSSILTPESPRVSSC